MRSARVLIVALLLATSPALVPATSTRLNPNFSAAAASPDSQPCYSQAGAQYYTTPLPKFPVPKVRTKGTVITVTSSSDDVDGEVSSVAALLANPGPDGTISLREAIDATNNSPGNYTIDFAPSLNGSTITLTTNQQLEMAGGNVLVNGSVYGDGRRGITVAASPADEAETGVGVNGFSVQSSGNTLYGLNVENFGVSFGADVAFVGTGVTLANNILEDLNLTSSVTNSNAVSLEVGNHTTVTGTVIADSYVEGANSAVSFATTSSNVMLKGTDILNSTIISTTGIAVYYIPGFFGGNYDGWTDGIIAYDTIVAGPGFGIYAQAGGNSGGNDSSGGGNYNTIDGLQIIGNNVTAIQSPQNGASAIDVQASGEPSYSVDNIVENVSILGNTIVWNGAAGIDLGKQNGVGNTMRTVLVEGNNVTTVPTIGVNPPDGGIPAVKLVAATFDNSRTFNPNPSRNNSISGVVIQSNTLKLVGLQYGTMDGIQLLGAGDFDGSDNAIRDVSITSNLINANSGDGITAAGAGWFNEDIVHNDSIFGLSMICNAILTKASSNPIAPISIWGSQCPSPGPSCSNNTVSGVFAEDNLVSMTLNNMSLFSSETGEAWGNSVSNVTVISHYLLQSGQFRYRVSVDSNCSSSEIPVISGSSFAFVYGSSGGDSGYSNMTFPTNLLNASPAVKIDGKGTPFTLSSNGTDYSVYVTFHNPPSISTGGPLLTAPTTVEISAASTSTATTSTATTFSASSTSIQSVTTSSAASSASSKTGGGGIPEFPFQAIAAVAFTSVVVLSYLLLRLRRGPLGR